MKTISGYRRKVIEAELESGGQGAFNGLPLGNKWLLKLECGHEFVYPARYKFPQRRHWWHRRAPEDAMPAPKAIQCRRCKWDATHAN